MPEEMLTSREVARKLRMSERTVHRLARKGTLPGVKVGRRWLFSRSALDEWLKERLDEGGRLPGGGTYPAAPAPVRLADAVHPRSISLNLKGRDVESVVKELVELASASGAVPDPQRLARLVLQRERYLTTGIERGVAIPHPRRCIPDLGRDLVLAVGVAKDGVDYGSLDGRPTRLFFLICARDEATHIRAVAALTRMLHPRSAVEKLLRAETVEDFMATFSQLEHGRA